MGSTRWLDRASVSLRISEPGLRWAESNRLTGRLLPGVHRAV